MCADVLGKRRNLDLNVPVTVRVVNHLDWLLQQGHQLNRLELGHQLEPLQVNG